MRATGRGRPEEGDRLTTFGLTTFGLTTTGLTTTGITPACAAFA